MIEQEYCQRLVEVLTDYLEGALGEAEREVLEAHLLECDDCREYVAQFRRTIELSGRIEAESLTAETRSGLLHAFRAWRA